MAAELWRGHQQKVLTHQFRVIATPRCVAVAARAAATASWDYRHRFDVPALPLGLAAVKQAQAQELRERVVADARFNAGVLARHHWRGDANEVSTVGRLNQDELLHIARMTFIAGMKLRQRTLSEMCEWHRGNGTLAQFLAALKLG